MSKHIDLRGIKRMKKIELARRSRSDSGVSCDSGKQITTLLKNSSNAVHLSKNSSVLFQNNEDPHIDSRKIKKSKSNKSQIDSENVEAEMSSHAKKKHHRKLAEDENEPKIINSSELVNKKIIKSSFEQPSTSSKQTELSENCPEEIDDSKKRKRNKYTKYQEDFITSSDIEQIITSENEIDHPNVEKTISTSHKKTKRKKYSPEKAQENPESIQMGEKQPMLKKLISENNSQQKKLKSIENPEKLLDTLFENLETTYTDVSEAKIQKKKTKKRSLVFEEQEESQHPLENVEEQVFAEDTIKKKSSKKKKRKSREPQNIENFEEQSHPEKAMKAILSSVITQQEESLETEENDVTQQKPRKKSKRKSELSKLQELLPNTFSQPPENINSEDLNIIDTRPRPLCKKWKIKFRNSSELEDIEVIPDGKPTKKKHKSRQTSDQQISNTSSNNNNIAENYDDPNSLLKIRTDAYVSCPKSKRKSRKNLKELIYNGTTEDSAVQIEINNPETNEIRVPDQQQLFTNVNTDLRDPHSLFLKIVEEKEIRRSPRKKERQNLKETNTTNSIKYNPLTDQEIIETFKKTYSNLRNYNFNPTVEVQRFSFEENDNHDYEDLEEIELHEDEIEIHDEFIAFTDIKVEAAIATPEFEKLNYINEGIRTMKSERLSPNSIASDLSSRELRICLKDIYKTKSSQNKVRLLQRNFTNNFNNVKTARKSNFKYKLDLDQNSLVKITSQSKIFSDVELADGFLSDNSTNTNENITKKLTSPVLKTKTIKLQPKTLPCSINLTENVRSKLSTTNTESQDQIDKIDPNNSSENLKPVETPKESNKIVKPVNSSTKEQTKIIKISLEKSQNLNSSNISSKNKESVVTLKIKSGSQIDTPVNIIRSSSKKNTIPVDKINKNTPISTEVNPKTYKLTPISPDKPLNLNLSTEIKTPPNQLSFSNRIPKESTKNTQSQTENQIHDSTVNNHQSSSNESSIESDDSETSSDKNETDVATSLTKPNLVENNLDKTNNIDPIVNDRDVVNFQHQDDSSINKDHRSISPAASQTSDLSKPRHTFKFIEKPLIKRPPSRQVGKITLNRPVIPDIFKVPVQPKIRVNVKHASKKAEDTDDIISIMADTSGIESICDTASVANLDDLNDDSSVIEVDSPSTNYVKFDSIININQWLEASQFKVNQTSPEDLKKEELISPVKQKPEEKITEVQPEKVEVIPKIDAALPKQEEVKKVLDITKRSSPNSIMEDHPLGIFRIMCTGVLKHGSCYKKNACFFNHVWPDTWKISIKELSLERLLRFYNYIKTRKFCYLFRHVFSLVAEILGTSNDYNSLTALIKDVLEINMNSDRAPFIKNVISAFSQTGISFQSIIDITFNTTCVIPTLKNLLSDILLNIIVEKKDLQANWSIIRNIVTYRNFDIDKGIIHAIILETLNNNLVQKEIALKVYNDLIMKISDDSTRLILPKMYNNFVEMLRQHNFIQEAEEMFARGVSLLMLPISKSDTSQSPCSTTSLNRNNKTIPKCDITPNSVAGPSRQQNAIAETNRFENISYQADSNFEGIAPIRPIKIDKKRLRNSRFDPEPFPNTPVLDTTPALIQNVPLNAQQPRNYNIHKPQFNNSPNLEPNQNAVSGFNQPNYNMHHPNPEINQNLPCTPQFSQQFSNAPKLEFQSNQNQPRFDQFENTPNLEQCGMNQNQNLPRFDQPNYKNPPPLFPPNAVPNPAIRFDQSRLIPPLIPNQNHFRFEPPNFTNLNHPCQSNFKPQFPNAVTLDSPGFNQARFEPHARTPQQFHRGGFKPRRNGPKGNRDWQTKPQVQFDTGEVRQAISEENLCDLMSLIMRYKNNDLTDVFLSTCIEAMLQTSHNFPTFFGNICKSAASHPSDTYLNYIFKTIGVNLVLHLSQKCQWDHAYLINKVLTQKFTDDIYNVKMYINCKYSYFNRILIIIRMYIIKSEFLNAWNLLRDHALQTGSCWQGNHSTSEIEYRDFLLKEFFKSVSQAKYWPIALNIIQHMLRHKCKEIDVNKYTDDIIVNALNNKCHMDNIMEFIESNQDWYNHIKKNTFRAIVVKAVTNCRKFAENLYLIGCNLKIYPQLIGNERTLNFATHYTFEEVRLMLDIFFQNMTNYKPIKHFVTIQITTNDDIQNISDAELPTILHQYKLQPQTLAVRIVNILNNYMKPAIMVTNTNNVLTIDVRQLNKHLEARDTS